MVEVDIVYKPIEELVVVMHKGRILKKFSTFSANKPAYKAKGDAFYKAGAWAIDNGYEISED